MNNRDVGNLQESSAAAYLIENGFTIIDRNYHAGRFGEIDLIATRGTLLVFVEVKARNSMAYGSAAQSVSKTKLNRLKYSARRYCAEHENALNMDLRFDLIAIDNNEIAWIQDILR